MLQARLIILLICPSLLLCNCSKFTTTQTTSTKNNESEAELSESLIRAIYGRSSISKSKIVCKPSGDVTHQSVSSLKKRLAEIRDTKGNIAFRTSAIEIDGTYQIGKSGVYDRDTDQFYYELNDTELLAQPIIVSLRQLNYYSNRRVISFTEISHSSFISENFEQRNDSNHFKMTQSALYLSD